MIGYRLYYGAISQQYTNFVDPGPLTVATVDGLSGGLTYYFAVTSLNSAGLESDFSGEVAYLMPVAQCPIVLSGLNQVYDGTPRAVSISAASGNLGVVLTYSGSLAPPINAGGYQVIAVSTDPSCLTSTTELLTIAKAPATVQLSNLSRTYDGTAKSVSISTLPPGLSVLVFYNNKPQAPSAPGKYIVLATIDDTNYQGSTLSSLEILPASASRTPIHPDLLYIIPAARQSNVPTRACLLRWETSIYSVKLWKSTDLINWTLLANVIGASNQCAINRGPKPLFFRATAVRPDGEVPLRLFILKP